MLSKTVSALLVAFAPAMAFSLAGMQTGAQAGAQNAYARHIWHTEDGLPEETVQALAQTPDHFLWIGTSGGLVRFDGAQFVVFNRENTPALRENSIFCLMVDKDGTLWIGTEGGGLLSYKQGAFQSWSKPQGLTDGYVRALCQDRNSRIWIGTDDGLFRVEANKATRFDGHHGMPFISVHAIYEDRDARLWVGGFHLFSISAERATEFYLPGGPTDNVKSITQTPDGTIWVGAVSGLNRLERNRPSPGNVFTEVKTVDTTVRTLRADTHGTLWIGTIGDGMVRLREGGFLRLTAPATLPSNTVLTSFEDSEQNVWIGTQTGLLRLSETPVTTFALPNAADVDFGTIYQDRDQSLWVAGTHLFRFIGYQAFLQHLPGPLSGVRVRNVFRDSSGVLWLGTEGKGAFRWEDGKLSEVAGVQPYIRAFAEDRDGSVWIGTDGTFCRWSKTGTTFYGQHESVRALLVDTRGDLWVGKDRGLSRLHNGEPAYDAATSRLQSEKVWAIHEDPSGGLWFGTRSNGLFRWKAGKLTSYTRAQGLASNSIYQILEDRRGVFWISGPNGISSVSRHALDARADDPADSPAVRLYGTSDGLETTQMYGGVQPAGCITSSGEIWFPSSAGPVKIGADTEVRVSPPPAVIYRVVADGRDVPITSDVVLTPGRGKLDIYYGAIRLRSQERVRFKYRLDGFDHDWSETSARRVASYTNIPPGHYRFRLIAFDMNAPRDASEASLPVSWTPHFYRAAWFFVLCFATLMAAAWGIHKMRMHEAQMRFDAVLEERIRLAREMHDTVIQGCTGVSALLEASVTTGTTAPAALELLDHARFQVRSTIDEARRAVWNLRHRPSASPDIESRLSAVTRQVNIDYGIRTRAEVSGQVKELEPEMEHAVLSVIREALFNAGKHARATNATVSLRFSRQHLHLSMADDGCGFDLAPEPHAPDSPSSLGHYGLLGMRERMEHLGGTLVLDTALGKGTRIDIHLPVRYLQDASAHERSSRGV